MTLRATAVDADGVSAAWVAQASIPSSFTSQGGVALVCGGITVIVPNPATATCASVAGSIGTGADFITAVDTCVIQNVAVDCAEALASFGFGYSVSQAVERAGPLPRLLGDAVSTVYEGALDAFMDQSQSPESTGPLDTGK